MDMYMDCHDASDGESDSGMPLSFDSHDMGLFTLLPVKPEESPNDCTAPKSIVPEDSSQQGGCSLQDSDNSMFPWLAEKLQDFLLAEERRREQAFKEYFKFDTHRCTPTAPCRSCLDFCKTPLPMALVGQVISMNVDDEDGPPVLKLTDAQKAAAAQKRKARHGPKSKSSEYRGVTLHNRTGRWEAHIWHDTTQVYLGSSETKEEAARAHDKAAILLSGPDVYLNFNSESYQQEMHYLYKLSKEQLVIYLRRDSRGYGAQAAYPGVKHVRNRCHAMNGTIFLKAFPTEEEAARAVYNEAVLNSNGELASYIIDTHHVRNMPSYAARRFAALYPQALKPMQPRNENTASQSKRKYNSTSSSPTKKPSSGATPMPINDLSPASSAAMTTAASSDPGPQMDEGGEVLSPAGSHNGFWPSQPLAHQRHRPPAACMELEAQAPTAPKSWPHPHVKSIPKQQRSQRPTKLNLGIHGPPATTALSSNQAASVLSSFIRTGPQASSSTPNQKLPSTPSSDVESPPVVATTQAGIVKFKLFNVEICAPVTPDTTASR